MQCLHPDWYSTSFSRASFNESMRTSPSSPYNLLTLSYVGRSHIKCPGSAWPSLPTPKPISKLLPRPTVPVLQSISLLHTISNLQPSQIYYHSAGLEWEAHLACRPSSLHPDDWSYRSWRRTNTALLSQHQHCRGRR